MTKCHVFHTRQEAESIIPLNTIRKIQIEDRQYCLANTSQGFIAFEKECPHLRDDLSKGTLNTTPEVVCPWHSYRFNLITGDEHANRCGSLKIFQTEWDADGLHIYVE